jgi:hypothetical protein
MFFSHLVNSGPFEANGPLLTVNVLPHLLKLY